MASGISSIFRKYSFVIVLLAILAIAGCVSPPEEKPEGVTPTEVTEVKIGSLLPITGDLAQFGGPMEDAAKLAIKEVNENGGVLGAKIKLITEDSQTSETAAADAMNKLVKVDKVPAVIGGAGSGISMAMISIAINNEVVQISPASTSPDFTTYPDQDFFFRTAPSDALQGKAMAKLAIKEGYKNVSTFVINNPYGTGFEKVFIEEFEKLDGKVINTVRYDAAAVTFDSEVAKASEGNPEVIMLVSYPETGSLILKTAYEKGVMENTKWLLSEGLRSDDLAEMVGKDEKGKYIIAGFKGTTPDPRVTGPAYENFKNAYEKEYGRKVTTFCSNTYDAAAIIALAIEKAGKASGPAIRDAIREVANPPGTEVTDLGEALKLIREGKDINYQGASGEITFDENGDVSGRYSEWQIAENGSAELGEPIVI
ncbi:MAG: ABC transporter substrate-binding protein [Methanosarcinales archaeon]